MTTDTDPLSAPHRKHERIYLLPPVMHDGEYVVTWCDIDPTGNREGQQYVRFDVHNTIVGEAVTALSARVASQAEELEGMSQGAAELDRENDRLKRRVAELEAEEQKQRLGREYLLFSMRQFTEGAGRAVEDDWEPTTLWSAILTLKRRADGAEARATQAIIERDEARADLVRTKDAADRAADEMTDRWHADQAALAEARAREAGMREALKHAEAFITEADHGDNCFLHDEGEFSRCRCGKDGASEAVTAALLAQPDQTADPLVTAYDNGVDQAWGVAKPLALAAEGVISWCDVALSHADRFDSHGVRNLTGPAFDMLRETVEEARSAGLLITVTTEGAETATSNQGNRQ